VRHPLQPQGPQYYRILSVAIDIPQSAIAQHQVHNQNECHRAKTYDQRFISMREAFLKPILQTQFLEKSLKYDRT
jgi:hypothetical protein